MWLLSLFAVVFCAYFLASMTAQLVSVKLEGDLLIPQFQKVAEESLSENATADDPEAYQAVVERNIFDSKYSGASTPVGPTETTEPTEEDVATDGKAVPTSLSIKLLSTFSVGAGVDTRSSCVISGGSAKSDDVYTVGDKKQFAPDTKIVRILYDRVEFLNKKRLEYALLEDFAKAAPPSRVAKGNAKEPAPPKEKEAEETKVEQSSEGQFVVDRAEIDAAIANIDKLYTEVRAVPHFKDGSPDGLKLMSVKSGSLFSKLGLKRGDILKKINGNELDIKKGLDLFNQLKSETQIALEVERKGAVQTMQYEIR